VNTEAYCEQNTGISNVKAEGGKLILMLLLLLFYDKINKNESEGNVKVMGA